MRGSSKPISAVSAVVAAGVVFVALLAWRSRGWPLIHDVALMHYVAWPIGALGVVRWLERRRLVSLVWSGAVLGAGISVKPHAALFAGALAAVVAIAAARACGAATAGAASAVFVGALAVAPLAVLGWLAATGGLAAWYDIVVHYLIPLYSRLGR